MDAAGRSSWNTPELNSIFRPAILVCGVAALAYIAARLGGALVLYPQNVWPLWPGCALIVSILLLVPRRSWAPLIAAAGRSQTVARGSRRSTPRLHGPHSASTWHGARHH